MSIISASLWLLIDAVITVAKRMTGVPDELDTFKERETSSTISPLDISILQLRNGVVHVAHKIEQALAAHMFTLLEYVENHL
eukprot:CAMPEP_0117587156 /NCGR_PEP_ID=MMETSP0784-20121206/69126_1 /TAXON_ID=39447 /ORGANISM="" /LENGTH=81 /DNA_ID=CAMNT_0005388347 /DNA_START=186 /DNA_END=431 /DNA_ORIENTATION=+